LSQRRGNPPIAAASLIAVASLALDKKSYGDLVMAMNTKLNARIDEEVGVDDGSFLPIRNGKWYFPSPQDR
jgi:hypothetical protein